MVATQRMQGYEIRSMEYGKICRSIGNTMGMYTILCKYIMYIYVCLYCTCMGMRLLLCEMYSSGKVML